MDALHILALSVAAGAVGLIWLFWSLYVICMGFYAAHLDGTLKSWNLYAAAPWIVLGTLFDVGFQFLIATPYFMDWPARGEYLVTQRLKRYRATEPDSWRGRRAARICELRLNPFDPRRKHC